MNSLAEDLAAYRRELDELESRRLPHMAYEAGDTIRPIAPDTDRPPPPSFRRRQAYDPKTHFVNADGEIEANPPPVSGLKDSGLRSVSVTGGLRETDDPARGFFELLPPGPLTRLAAHYARGATKYTPRNWERGIETGRCFRSMVRHCFAYLAGDRTEDHLAAIAWNAFALMHHEDAIRAGSLPRELDTLPCLKKETA